MGRKWKKCLCYLVAITVMLTIGACGQDSGSKGTRDVIQTNDSIQVDGCESLVDESQKVLASEKEERASDSISEERGETVANDIPFKEVPEDADDNELYEAELYNFKVIQSLEPAYESEGYITYAVAAAQLNNSWTGESHPEMASQVRELRKGLVQIRSYESCVWPIWGEMMAVSDNDQIQSADFLTSTDNEDFVPFLIPYLLEDQSSAKGNIIVIAGGGYNARMNSYEGFPVAEKFKDLGYNAYVLQRRVAPYSQEDIWMDMQRAVRYIRYYGEEKELGGLECIAAAGFSGGGSTILGQIANCYGNLTPDQLYDTDYIPDALDSLSADLDVAILIYGPMYDYELQSISDVTGALSGTFKTDNPKLPAFFIAAGQGDAMETDKTSLELYLSVCDLVPTEMHLYRDAGHGFGVGFGLDSTTYEDVITANVQSWPELADTFIDIQTGKLDEFIYPNR